MLYVKKTYEQLGFKVTRAEFILKSEVLPRDITFSATEFPELNIGTSNPTNIEHQAINDRYSLLINILKTMYELIYNSRILLCNIKPETRTGCDVLTNDLITMNGMLQVTYHRIELYFLLYQHMTRESMFDRKSSQCLRTMTTEWFLEFNSLFTHFKLHSACTCPLIHHTIDLF